MILTPAIKGQLTKAVKSYKTNDSGKMNELIVLAHTVRTIFAKHMPKQQAKHAARKYLATC